MKVAHGGVMVEGFLGVYLLGERKLSENLVKFLLESVNEPINC